MATKKGTDSDEKTNKAHPVYAIRTFSGDHKAALMERIEKVVKAVNARIGSSGRKKTTHEVVIDAIQRGLDIIEAEAKKK